VCVNVCVCLCVCVCACVDSKHSLDASYTQVHVMCVWSLCVRACFVSGVRTCLCEW